MRYFTINYTPAGIGDQIWQHEMMYKVGRSIGLGYLYSDFVLGKQHHVGDLNRKFLDFSGFYTDETSVSDNRFRDYKRIIVDVVEIVRERKTADEVKKYFNDNFSQDTNVIFIFKWEMKYYKDVAKVIVPYLRTLDTRPLAYEFYEKFEKAKPCRASLDLELPFEEGRKNVAFHIRRGENSYPKINGKYVWVLTGDIFDTEEEGIEWVKQNHPRRPYIPIYKFEEKLKELIALHGEENLRVAIFSDGFGENILNHFKYNRDPGFNRFRALYGNSEKRLLQLLSEYEKNEFSPFSRYRNVRLYIGETEELFFRAIYAFITCDILVKSIGSFTDICRHFRKKMPHQIELVKALP